MKRKVVDAINGLVIFWGGYCTKMLVDNWNGWHWSLLEVPVAALILLGLSLLVFPRWPQKVFGEGSPSSQR
jgi:hypothetical protein